MRDVQAHSMANTTLSPSTTNLASSFLWPPKQYRCFRAIQNLSCGAATPFFDAGLLSSFQSLPSFITEPRQQQNTQLWTTTPVLPTLSSAATQPAALKPACLVLLLLQLEFTALLRLRLPQCGINTFQACRGAEGRTD